MSLSMDGRILDPNVVGTEDADGKASAEAWEIPFSDLCAQLEPEMVKRELMLPAPDTKLRLCPSVAHGFADPRTREDPAESCCGTCNLPAWCLCWSWRRQGPSFPPPPLRAHRRTALCPPDCKPAVEAAAILAVT